MAATSDGVDTDGPAPAPSTMEPAVDEAGGALRLDQISVAIRAGALELRVTPLHPQVIRLAAADLRPRLRRLLADAADQAEADHESRFLVTFTTHAADQEFLPADVRFEIGGVRVETVSMLPITAGWGSQRLRAREPESAVYVIRSRFDPYSSLRIYYGTATSDGWREVVPMLRAEERRVQ